MATAHVEVPLTQGKVALVDVSDYEYVSQFRWQADNPGKTWYAKRSVWESGRSRSIRMHSDLTGFRRTDHKNRNGLDNRRSNLREASAAQNGMNSDLSVGGTSRFRGVCWLKEKRRWCAYIGSRSTRRYYLGHYRDEEAAARAYDEAARELHGEFARLNFPEG